jgi:NAD(P)-dependent dehydrogenase (short-subunit alcohol dehydrogenase family)
MINPLSAISSLVYFQLIFPPQLPKQIFSGKTIMVIGTNAGLGEAACRHSLNLNCARLILAVRTPAKGEKAKKAMLESTGKTNTDVQVWALDLGLIASIKAFVKRAS